MNLKQPVSIAPLAVFRILFGMVMLVSMIRFMLKGWIEPLYVEPSFHFSYYGFAWVQSLGLGGMYALFSLLAFSAACIMLGWRYRLFSWIFFLGFTYVELIDKTTYLNHYYFVSLVSFLLCWLPAHRAYSLDVWRKPEWRLTQVPRWMILGLQVQLAMLYLFAGIAKLHPDWLLRAMPLSIWLPPHADLPLIGNLFTFPATAFLFSWLGALYDLSICFFLWWKKSRPWAYLAVIAFHLMTALLFDIGMFPWIMMLATLIFFSGEWHEQLLNRLSRWRTLQTTIPVAPHPRQAAHWVMALFILHLSIQVLLPWRYMLYPGELFWHEQGYRFSWRVMLMEKNGEAVFTVKDPATGQEWEPIISTYLSPLQEKMMATQPDMILQFAHFLQRTWQEKGIATPQVYAQSYVSLNGRRSRPLLDESVDLAQEPISFRPKSWILPFEPISPLPVSQVP